MFIFLKLIISFNTFDFSFYEMIINGQKRSRYDHGNVHKTKGQWYFLFKIKFEMQAVQKGTTLFKFLAA
jgi:hypothetical protein